MSAEKSAEAPRTPEEWAAQAVEAFSDGNSVSDVLRAAMQDALERAADYVEECNTPHHDILAGGIRDLLSEGKPGE